jgi:glutamine synthetase adenylyltransferase
MLSFLKILWTKYKKLNWLPKILLAIPLLVAAAICLSLFFVRGSGDGRKFEDTVKHHKRHVDKQIKEKLAADKFAEQRQRELRAHQEALVKEAKKNEKKAKETVSHINSAVKHNDLAELERIRRQLNARSRRRRKP